MKLRYLLLLWALFYVELAQAEIYKIVDSKGHVTYSSTPQRGAHTLKLAPLATKKHVKPRRHSNIEAANFPRVDRATQSKRDDKREKILEDELSAERKALVKARADLLEITDDSGSARDTIQAQLTMHVKNIQALKTELSNLKK
ncbi:MAG: DUF4124 domain-containing protein [Gallionellaceae bacterium]